MFESALAEKFQTTFDFDLVRYDQPSDSREQNVLFVQIDRAKSWIKDGIIRMRVEGSATVFSPSDRMPFGYFAKQIDTHKDILVDIFFHQIEENQRVYQNIVQRGFSFVYFYSSQYNPPTGTITTIEESEE